MLSAQAPPAPVAPPDSSGGIFPLSEVHRGLTGTAWTVFTGNKPEAMTVEILGVLRGARGPGHDMILAQLHGAKPEYTGVVAGMSGTPVYIGNRLLGALAYRIGQFSKDPIAGITPIEQMLEVRDLPVAAAETKSSGTGTVATGSDSASLVLNASGASAGLSSPTASFQAMETPLVMNGFRPEAVRLWQQKMAGTALQVVALGGSGSSQYGSGSSVQTESGNVAASSTSGVDGIEPGSAISAQLVRGDLEMAATCTVTYVDPKQLLACGHPLLQAGKVSLPMTTAEVVATLASPLDSFKIVNTGTVIGSFTEDRDAAIRGVFGAKANMIPVQVTVRGAGSDRKINFEILDLPSLTPQALMVTLYNSLLESNQSTEDNSYHLQGSIDLQGYSSVPLDLWGASGGELPAGMDVALKAGDKFSQIYGNGARQNQVRGIDIQIEAFPRSMGVELVSARLTSGNIVHAGDRLTVEATVRPWQKPAKNVRIRVQVPERIGTGNLRLLVSDGSTLDQLQEQSRTGSQSTDLDAVVARLRQQHSADRIYVSLLIPEAQAGISGQTLAGLPLSVANTLEPLRSSHNVNLNGESAEVAGEADAGGVLSGSQILTLRIEQGGGLK
jgi:hypothetical protein